ncbi:hybrid-cluster NAD(P)-dependent oxidoreductase [Vibrio cincinnatiensis]|uniref:hybrid-cluster NAD(P)-dependent oxidoreductase n=1 Tax=Vibrio cincinnatiensis TaxID=675 RepID=UPI001EDEF75B|nr:hybrid-cluster NAD(P)-dependent oxidoreductase [Vibrio cincinnatiensis]MCG3733026.1 MOSC domain-containing protein [Vibrio cincinnatiensis]MCG3740427.1 MOSC domain-containing protein [Vibrio cincinnatiensis]MCG3743929.1 MOSC domain-containing protein [Vibrio cincinnatiensis]
MSSALLSKISVYPVKSIGGLSLSSAWVEKQGLLFDRRFMLAFADGGMVTARKYPTMVNIRSVLTPDGLIFSAPNRPSLKVCYQTFKMQPAQAQVWKDCFTAYTTTDEANDWFSDVLGRRVELLFTGEQSHRIREKVGSNVSFADGYPVLVISQGSLDELNRRSVETHSMDQFRTNLVVSGTEPFAEDGWKRIRIGEVEFEAVKPCERCILTTVDVEKGEFRASKEPLGTLSQFRANEQGGVFFGQNLIAKNEGMIHVGDEIEVLEYKEKEIYIDHGFARYQMTCVERETIANNFVTFWLEPDQAMPDYLPGQHLPIDITLDGETISRCYTLSSSPSRPGRLAISVKGIEGGLVSNWLLDNLHIGDTLETQSPNGSFHLQPQPSYQPLLLLSAGSGVTPMLSMIRYLADQDQLHDVVFYHQCRTVNDIPVREELDELKRTYPGFKMMICLTQPPIDWFGLKGRLSLSHLKQISNLSQRQVFVCGPEGFMQKAKNLLLKQGLPEGAYHQEAFGVALSLSKAYKTVQISLDGKVFRGNNQSSLLEQAEAAGVPIASSCRAGFCGACKVTVASGKVSQPELPALLEEERHLGKVLACSCIPETDIEVVSD